MKASDHGGRFGASLRLLGLFFGLIAAAAIGGNASADEMRNVPGTAVAIIPPAGFQPAPSFAGFVDSVRGGSILVVELPRDAFGDLLEVFSSVEGINSAFQRGGVKIDSLEEMEVATGEIVPLAHGTQVDANGTFDKWIAVYGGSKTAMVTLQVLKQNALDPRVVKEVFASVRFQEPASVGDQLALLPFKIEIFQPFRFLGSPTGAGVLLTVGPSDVNANSLQPIVMVLHQVGPAANGSLQSMAETQLRSTSNFAAARIVSQRKVRFAGVDGLIFNGETTLKDGQSKHFIQYFGIGESGHSVRFVAAGDKPQLDELREPIEKIVSSIAFKN